MSLDPTVFKEEFAAVIADTWPEVVADGAGIYEIKQAQALSDEQIDAQGGWPYAVFNLGSGVPAEYGIVNSVLRADLIARWLDQDSVDDSDVQAKLRLLAKAAMAATFTGMTVEEVGDIHTGPADEAEQIFLRKNAAFVSGRVTLVVVYGETALG